MRKPLALIPAAQLLASCGTADAEPHGDPVPTDIPSPTFEEPEPVTLDTPQSFEFVTADGAVGTLTIPAEPLPQVDEYLALVGDPKPLTYAVVDVDNRNGFSEYGVYEVNLYTPGGEKVTFENLNNAVIGWDHDVPIEHVDAYYDLTDATDVAVGERKDEYAITEQPLPSEVARIEVTQVGGGAAQAYPEAVVTDDFSTSGETQQEWMDQQ